MVEEIPLSFSCEGDWLYGLLHLPEQPVQRGVVIIVGGPQYRVGSHRQFLLFARQLSEAGVAVLRFDYRGMGDSEGEVGKPEPCEHVNADIRSAVDCFIEHIPQLKEIVLLGLCDGASAAMLYGYTDDRVTGMALLNPWVSTEEGAAKTYVKDYYLKRLVSVDFWKKVFKVELSVRESISSFFQTLATAFKPKSFIPASNRGTSAESLGKDKNVQLQPLNDRIAEGINNFKGRVLIVLSGRDLIASEFKTMTDSSRKWKAILRSSRITRHDLPEADHTFSNRVWHDKVVESIKQWMA